MLEAFRVLNTKVEKKTPLEKCNNTMDQYGFSDTEGRTFY